MPNRGWSKKRLLSAGAFLATLLIFAIQAVVAKNGSPDDVVLVSALMVIVTAYLVIFVPGK